MIEEKDGLPSAEKPGVAETLRGFDEPGREPDDLYGQLRAESAAGSPAPQKRPDQLSLADLHLVPGVFQPRENGTDEARAKEIAKGLTGTGTDERIHCWWSGRRWIVIDGHHRVEAYQHLARSRGKTVRVPVECHVRLNVAEAVSLSRKLNDRGRERLSREEIATACWRIVLDEELSIKRTAELTTLSTRNVSNMRKVAKDLLNGSRSRAKLREMSWREARKAAQVIGDVGEWTSDDARAKGKEWAALMNKATGFQAVHDPEAFTWALAFMTDNGSVMSRVLHTEAFEETLREDLEEAGWEYRPDAEEE